MTQKCRGKCCGSPRPRIPNVTVETAVEALLPRLISFWSLASSPGPRMQLIFRENQVFCLHITAHATQLAELCAYSFLALSWDTENHEVMNIQTICERLWNPSSIERRGNTQGKLKICTFMAKQKKTTTSKQKQLSKCAAQSVTPAAPEGLWQVDWKSLQEKL